MREMPRAAGASRRLMAHGKKERRGAALATTGCGRINGTEE